MVARINLAKDLAMKAESTHMIKMKTLHKELVEGMEKAHDKGFLEASDKESQDLKSEVIELDPRIGTHPTIVPGLQESARQRVLHEAADELLSCYCSSGVLAWDIATELSDEHCHLK